ncbi:MAG: hypothetical protein IJ371_06290 [Clostridia bacterium]|nr:hypothetical protein [Clostridia bacterium]
MKVLNNDNNFVLSDLIDYLKTYSWLSFIINNPNTDEKMDSEFEKMKYKMENTLFYYINKKNIDKETVLEIIQELIKDNYNGLEALYECYKEK